MRKRKDKSVLGVGRKEYTGFRTPTDYEKLAVWKLCGPTLIHENKWFKFCSIFTVGFAGMLSLAVLASLIPAVSEGTAVASITSFLIFVAVTALFDLIAWTTVKHVKETGLSIQNIQNGDFKVLDVVLEEFDPNIDQINEGVVRFSCGGAVCRDHVVVNLEIAKKYRGKNRIPMLYVWEPVGDFYRAYAEDEIRQAAEPVLQNFTR